MRAGVIWIILGCCSLSGALRAQVWEDRSVFRLQDAYDVQIVDSVWLVTTAWSIARAQQDGADWDISVHPIPTYDVPRRAKFAGNSTIYVVSSNSTIYKSTDLGETWTELLDTLPASQLRGVDFISPTHGVIVGEHDSESDTRGLIAITYDGETFAEMMLPEFANRDLLAVDLLPSGDIWAVGGYYADMPPLILHATDFGETWDSITVDSLGWLTSVHFWNDSAGIVAGKNGLMLRTEDQGDTWTAIASGITQTIRDFATIGDSMLFASAQAGIIGRSLNRGSTWQLDSLGSNIRWEGIDAREDGLIVATGYRGRGVVAISHDYGDSWTLLGTDSIFWANRIAAVDSHHVMVACAIGTVISSDNSGRDWTFRYVGYDKNLVTISYLDSQNALVGGEVTGFYKTDNGGESWWRPNQLWGPEITAVKMLSESRWLVGFDIGSITETDDGGFTWTICHNAGPDGIREIASFDGVQCWAIGDADLVLWSDDAGNSWNQVTNAPQAAYRDLHCFADGSMMAAIATGTVLYFENDGTALDGFVVSDSSSLTSIAFAGESMGWCTSWQGEIFATLDRGRTWELQHRADRELHDLAVGDNQVYVLGSSNLILAAAYIDSGTSVPEQEEPFPQIYSLSVFPNPFNSNTTLQFALPREAHAEIILFDVLGREALKLADDVFAAGAHSLTVNAENLATGIYFAELRTPEFSTTRKLLLLK